MTVIQSPARRQLFVLHEVELVAPFGPSREPNHASQCRGRMLGAVQTPQPGDFGIGRLFWVMRDAAMIADAATRRIVLWNPAAEALFRYSAQEAVGLPLERLISVPGAFL